MGRAAPGWRFRSTGGRLTYNEAMGSLDPRADGEQQRHSGGDAVERARRMEARAKQRLRQDVLASEHERIAAALANGEFGERELARAREQVAKWIRGATCGAWYAKRWSEILSGTPAAVAVRLRGLEADERRALVQNTPFGFLLTDRVRG